MKFKKYYCDFSMTLKKKISLVVPFYNEESGVERFFQSLQTALQGMHGNYDFEVVCINDGSRDETLGQLVQARQKHNNISIRIVDFSRNFGKESAITAGLDFAMGDAVVPIDSDLQHPPALVPEMLALWESGYEVVLARRANRNTDRAIYKIAARTFYEVSRHISHTDIPPDVGDFRLMDRKVVDAVNSLRENCRFMKGIFAWVGFRTAVVDYQVQARHQGKSKFNGWKLWNLALDGITSFSTVPLRMWTYVGSLIAIAAFFYALYLIVKTLVFGAETPGFASLMSAILFASGVQLMGIGILGEYIGRVYAEVKGRPAYIVREVIE